MSVKAIEIKVGSVLYPQNFAGIREVRRIEGKDAYWYGYNRHTGEHFDQGLCTVQHLAQWAARFATEEEIALLQRPKR